MTQDQCHQTWRSAERVPNTHLSTSLLVRTFHLAATPKNRQILTNPIPHSKEETDHTHDHIVCSPGRRRWQLRTRIRPGNASGAAAW
jgi:hypothetical protein